MSTPKKRRLFLSFSRTVWDLREKRIKPSQLKGGLFFFGCRRRYTLNPNAIADDLGAVSEDCPEIADIRKQWREAQKILADELVLAEKEGRVKYRWRERTVDQFERLNKLLVANDLPALRAPTEEERKRHRGGARTKKDWDSYVIRNPDGYSPHLVFNLIKEQLADLVEVVY